MDVRKERELGLIEKYQLSKYLTKASGNMVLAVHMEHVSIDDPHEYKSTFEPILTRLVDQHPSLSVVVRNKADKHVHFEQLKMDVSRMMQVVKDNSSVGLERMIKREISHTFDLDSNLPLWRLKIIPKTNVNCVLLFTMHPIIGDATSLSILCKDFVNELNRHPTKTSQLGKPYELVSGTPQISLLWDAVPVLIQNIVSNFLPTQETRWQGDYPTKLKGHDTEIQLISIPQDIVKPIMMKAQENNVGIHAILYMVFLIGWAKLYPDEITEVSTPINSRLMCNVSNNQIGNYVGAYTSIWKSKELLKGNIWSLALKYEKDYKQSQKESSKQYLFLKYLPAFPESYLDYWDDKRSNSRFGKSGGLELNDLGQFKGVNKQGDEWKVQDVYFTTSSELFTTALGMNSIMLNDHLYCTLSWQKGTLEKAKIDKFHDIFLTILKNILL